MMTWRNPLPTVDALIALPGDRIVLIQRAHPPLGWAFPGGFVDEGESTEAACLREALEETGLTITLDALLGVYSDPARDPRRHTLSVVYAASAEGEPVAGDDAASVSVVPLSELLDRDFAFDHGRIARDYLHWRQTGQLPLPRPPGASS